MPILCGIANKRVAALTDSSGCVTTTTNAADGENADPKREAD